MSGNLKKLTSILTLKVIAVFWLSAQNVGNVGISGFVVDEKGEALIGAAVYSSKDNSLGTVTGLDGEFSIKVPAGLRMMVSCIGYEDYSFDAYEAKSMRIVLKETVEDLEGTVVVGYGTQKKESLVGSISTVSSEALSKNGTMNITTALSGNVAGLTTVSHGGAPGANSQEILIRGLSSWNGSAPLVMIDGAERDFSELDPNEVESISVLKDASATAVFGAKGANGVILVTTKRGTVSKPKFSANVTFGLDFPTMIPDHISSATTARMLNVARKNAQSWAELYSEREIAEYENPSSAVNSIRYADTDWFGVAMKTAAPSVTSSVTASGGIEKFRYFLSFGLDHQTSAIRTFRESKGKGFSYDRFNFRANFDINPWKSTLISIRFGGNVSVRTVPTGSAGNRSENDFFSYMYGASPMMYPEYYPEWLLDEVPDTDYPDASGIRYAGKNNAYYPNVVSELSTGAYSKSNTTRIFSDLILDQKLDFITKGLSLKATASLTTSIARVSEQISKTIPLYVLDWNIYDSGNMNPWKELNSTTDTGEILEENAAIVNIGGGLASYVYDFYLEAALNYNRHFGDHNVSALALYQQRSSSTNAGFPYRTLGVVGRVTYDYKNTYLFEANLGYTGSEQFSPRNRFGFFPSVAVGYVPSRYKWWKSRMPVWSKFKIRFSEGLVGNDRTSQRWLYYSSYSRAGSVIVEDFAANYDAKWETALKSDLGMEFGFFKDKLTLVADLYAESRKDMLVQPIVTALSGTSFKQRNEGEMKKHGIELELGWKEKRSGGFGYYLKAMFSIYENRIVRFADAPYAPDYQKTAGKAFGGQTMGIEAVDSGYFTDVDDIHGSAAYTDNWNDLFVGAYKYNDYNADGKIDFNDLHPIKGTQYAPASGSFHFGFDYKGFDFHMIINGVFGNYVNYNSTWEVEFSKGDLRVNRTQLDYWRPDNTDANHSSLTFGGAAGHPMYTWAGGDPVSGYQMRLRDRTWRKADYVNLKEMYLGYTFSKKMLGKSGFDAVGLFATANNLFTLTNLAEGDPKCPNLSGGFYPNMLLVKLGLKVQF